jgi:hypothetical protein
LVFHVLSCLVLTCLFLSSSARISSTFQSLGLVYYYLRYFLSRFLSLISTVPSLLFDCPSGFPFVFHNTPPPSLCLLSQTSWRLQLQLGT